MTRQRPLRSVLYVPGDNERAIKKAPSLPVDVILYDLEDAVAPGKKDQARARVCAIVRERGPVSGLTAIRINDLSTKTGALDALAALEACPDAIVLPKVQSEQDLMDLSSIIDRHDNQNAVARLEIWAMMETPLAILNAQKIAELSHGAVPRLGALIMGTNDLGKQTGVALDQMSPWLMSCVLAAKAADLPILDGVHNAFLDDAGLMVECERGRDMGFDGKTLIHPRQIACANKVFSPSDQQLQEAVELVALFERDGHDKLNVLELNGVMVERLHYEMALKTLNIARMIQERTQ